MLQWREKLHKKLQIPTPELLTKPTKAPSVSFVSSSGRGIQKNKVHIEPVSNDANGWPAARDWRDLEAELDDAQRRYEAGEIDAEVVEQVAHRAIQLARLLPEDAEDTGSLIPMAIGPHF